jgi:hypothetical protein
LFHDNAANFLEMKRGFLVAGFVGTFQADESGQRGCVAAFQTESLVGGMMTLLFAGVVVVGTPQSRVTEDALDLDGLSALADFPGLGLISGIDLIRRFLEKLADKFPGGFEDGGAQQFFKISNEGTTRLGGAEGGDQFLDFFLAGEVEVFFD